MIDYIQGLKNTLTFKQGVLLGAVAFMGFVLMCQFVLWQIAALVIIAQLPICYAYARDLYARDYTLCFYFIFVALQSVHMMEHCAQMVQIHLLGHTFATSHGLFGAYLDTEWLHLSFDTVYIPFWTIYLIYKKCDIWMIVMLPLALWHGVEHIVIMDTYLRTGIVGSPGILAQGGLIGSPLSRPDLHAIYNLIETTLMVYGLRKAI